MQRPKIPCVVVVPVGPGTEMTFLNDTLRSVSEYSLPDSKIVVVDNTKRGLAPHAIENQPELVILRCESEPDANPLHGGLYLNLSRAYKFILDNYDFSMVFRLDDDALLIGAGADCRALEIFAGDPEIGCLGSYRVSCAGSHRDFTSARRALRAETSFKGALKDWRRWRSTRALRRRARRNGYEDGEHCLGAAAFYSRECLDRFQRLGFLERTELRTSHLGDDHIFGIMVLAAGLRIEDFATGDKPLGLAWQGLPASPADLVGMGKAVVHSVKYHENADQAAVRAEFRRLLSNDRRAV